MNRLRIQDLRFRNGILILIILTSYYLLPTTALAADPPKPTDYTLLAPIPLDGVEGGVSEKANAGTFIPGLFKLIIAIAMALAVLALMFGGIKYMSTDAFGEKSEAKNTISNALWGLALALSAWLILFTINPKLVDFTLKIPVQEIKGGTTPPVIGPPSGECRGCVTIGVEHKPPPGGCAPPGPCQVTGELNARLLALQSKLGGRGSLTVNESYPPTREHKAECHKFGSCVDVSKTVDTKVHAFVVASAQSGLKAEYEVESDDRKNAVIAASCGSPNPNAECKKLLSTPGVIKVLPPDPITGKRQITGEHYSVYLQ